MRIRRDRPTRDDQLTVGEIKHVHPFQFDPTPECAGALPIDLGRVFIKIYPCHNGQYNGVSIDLKKGYVMVVDMEQGNIQCVREHLPVTELDYDFIVRGARNRRGC